jgi:hypothetical protein
MFKTLKYLFELIFLMILPFTIIQFTSCNEENIIVNPDNNGIESLEGKINNWAEGANKELKLGKRGRFSFLSFGNSPIDINGNFNFNLNAPADSIIYSLIEWFGIDSSSTLQVENIESKGIDAYLNIFSITSNEPIGEVEYSNDLQNNGKGYFSISYLYAEGNMNIVGSKTSEHNSDNFKGTQMTIYNVHLKKGWNRLVYTVLEETKSGNVTSFYKDEWSNEVIENGKWYYSLY